MMTKKKLRAEIANLWAGIRNRDAVNTDLRKEAVGLRTRNGHLKSETRRLERAKEALLKKVETYEAAYHAAHEFLMHASAALTSSYTEPISAGDTPDDDD